ncbi:hypothetical protein SAMN04515671_2759 [Nakamurella panacisegetis]|uniref:Uncharacterized protein n=1 Tax=Nakamurella panacisegetis TaxID=1090615 RepID=A0A1H0PFX3_9ACTN|nr:hypothetical protein [Nakamurella panacisegetis]SDP03913.1 hypothetical protein SAMN04515671_2759 [Nakamurella panacisegetis]
MTSHNRSGFRRIPVISPEPGEGPEKPPRPVRLEGVVRDGVERGSVVLVDEQDAVLAQLMGGDQALLRDGVRVTVTGHFVTGLMTTVQQGRPFRVLDVAPDADADAEVPPAANPADCE